MKNLLILLLICPMFGIGQIQLQSSFENALPSGWQAPKGGSTQGKNYSPFALIEASETWSAAISSTYKVSGSTSWRGELRPGDREVYYGNPRQEISLTNKSTSKSYRQTTLRMSTFIPVGVWAPSSAEEVFPAQYHPHPITGSYTGGSPSFAIETKNDRYRAMVKGGKVSNPLKKNYAFFLDNTNIYIGYAYLQGDSMVKKSPTVIDGNYKVFYK